MKTLPAGCGPAHPAPARSRPGRLDWRRDGLDWPHREHSRFLEAGGLRWHVQQAGQGPAVLLVHGTGASTHSWRGLLPLLAERYTVIAPDLPGHGFSELPSGGMVGIVGMSSLLGALCEELAVDPAAGIGHSAGAAILAALALDAPRCMPAILSLNGAFLPFGGIAGQLFSPLARLLAGLSPAAACFARVAGDRQSVQRLMESTGSRIDDRGLALYQRLLRNPAHVQATLAMMARWDLQAFARRLPELTVPVLLAAADRDRTVPPVQARRVAGMIPRASLARLEGLGHLAHEEAPERVLPLLADLFDLERSDAPA